MIHAREVATSNRYFEEDRTLPNLPITIVYRNLKKVQNERTYTGVVEIVRKFKRRTVKGTHKQFVRKRRKERKR